MALTDGLQEVANAMPYVFGDAACPDCQIGFSVVDRSVPIGPPHTEQVLWRIKGVYVQSATTAFLQC
jgi:hypothetical protein